MKCKCSLAVSRSNAKSCCGTKPICPSASWSFTHSPLRNIFPEVVGDLILCDKIESNVLFPAPLKIENDK